MRKILLFSLAFFAITLQAKELVHEFNLGPEGSQFSPYDGNSYNAETKTFTAQGWGAGQIGLEDFDATKYYQLVLELASASSQPLRIKVEYKETGSQEYEIPIGKIKGIIDLNQHIITKIELKNWSQEQGTFVFNRLYLTGQSGKKYAEVLDNTEHNVGNWVGFNVDANKFTYAHAGAQLVFNYATNSEATEKWFQLQTKSNDAFLEGNAYALDNGTLNVTEGSTQHIITLTATDVTNLKAHGLAVNGHELTINNITLNYWDENTEVLWTGEVAVGNWEHDVIIESTAFADAKQGDKIVCLLTTTEGAQAQIKYTTGTDWHWVNLNACQDISGTTYEQMLTQEMITSIVAGHQVHIQGKNYTITAVELHAYTGPSEVWSGEQVFDGNWSNNVQIDKESFAEMEVGYRLALSINTMTAGQCVNVQAGDWTDFPHKELYVFTEEDVTAESKVIEFELSPVDVEIIKEKGLIVKGTSFTLTDVKVVPNVPSLTNMKHDLSITDAGMATIMLPYYVPALPEDMKAYTLMMQGDYIAASEVTTIMPDKAVLIVAPQGEYTLISVEGVSDALSSKEDTYTYGALVGTYKKSTVPTSANPTYNYVLQNGNEGVGFYQVQSDDIAINPYRAYLTCGYNNNNQQNAPLRLVFPKNAATSIENVTPTISAGKLIRNGRIYIQRDNKIYTIHGLKIQ